MYLSIWFGIVMSTSQSGCNLLHHRQTAPDISQMQVRRATVIEDPVMPHKGTKGTVATLINPDAPIPNVPPPGAKIRYSSIHTDDMVLAITFDDGPHAQNTPKLLDILKERNIKATFFMVGEKVHDYPAIVRRVVAEGHEIGNHTYSHPMFAGKSDQTIRNEMQRTADAVKSAAGYTMHLMRPPGGGITKHVEQMLYTEFGYNCILWSVDPQDWRRPGVSVVQNRLISGAHKGAILLTHDLHAPTITAIPKVLDDLLAKGYRFVTVSQLLNIEKNTMPVGVVVKPEDAVEQIKPATVVKDKHS